MEEVDINGKGCPFRVAQLGSTKQEVTCSIHSQDICPGCKLEDEEEPAKETEIVQPVNLGVNQENVVSESQVKKAFPEGRIN